jgi:hypothetical protein
MELNEAERDYRSAVTYELSGQSGSGAGADAPTTAYGRYYGFIIFAYPTRSTASSGEATMAQIPGFHNFSNSGPRY